MFTKTISTVLGLAVAVIASLLMLRYVSLVVSMGRPELQGWLGGNGWLAPILALVVFIGALGALTNRS